MEKEKWGRWNGGEKKKKKIEGKNVEVEIS